MDEEKEVLLHAKIAFLEDSLRDMLGCVAVNLDDQEFSDRIIYARARVTLEVVGESD